MVQIHYIVLVQNHVNWPFQVPIYFWAIFGLNFREDSEDPYGQQYGTVSTYDRMRA